MSDPDIDLLPGLRRGEDRALRALMDRRLGMVHGLAYRLLGDAFEAEDVAQEAFLKLWSAAPDWETGRARLSTWLCRVATNACYDRLRKKRPDLPGETLDPPDDRPGAQLSLERRERWDTLQTAMMALPETQRTALSLCYDQALPQREAAAVMEMTEKAYESLLVRARRALKEKVSEHV